MMAGGLGAWLRRRAESKIKIKVKSSGQECPLHTSASLRSETAPAAVSTWIQ
jgi:hypothetical protein